MAQKTINIGTGELTGDGESIRSAFSKANDNFTELYSNTTNVETSVDLHLNTAGATNNQILSWDGSDYVWRADNSGIALTDFSADPSPPAPSGNGSLTYNNTSGVFTLIPPVLNGLTATGDTDFGSNKITYANVYATEGDLPNANTYHGMFAHVHCPGAGYFAHAGNWIKLATDAQLQSLESSVASTYVTNVTVNSFIDSHINTSGATAGQILSWDGSDYAWVADQNGGGGGGGANVSVSDNPPAGTPTQGDLWWESDVGKLKIYYGSAWVDANPTGAGSSGGAATIQGLSDVNAGDTIAGGDFMLYDIRSNHFAFVNFEAEVNGLIDNRTGSSGHVSTQSQYTTTITTDAADPTDTAHHILGNTGSASVHNTSTGWYYGDVVSDPANPTTSVVLDIDQQRFTGAIQSDSITVGSGGGINAQLSTVDFQGATVNFGSATIAGGNAFNDVINTHLWSGSTAPTDGYVLSWNTSLLAGNGDYEWVAQSGGGGTWATLGDKDGASGPTDVVLGRNAVGNGTYSLSIGNAAISNTYGVAIGMETQAATYDINVGAFSGKNHVTTDHGYRVAVGAFAQQNNNPGDETGVGAIAVGTLAGDSNQGANAVAIGRYAGRNNQAAQSIVLNATGVDLENVTPDSFVVKPIRQEAQAQALYYNPATGEVTYEAAGGGGLTNVVDISTGARVDGVLELSEGVNEKLSILTGATGVVTHDCNNGYIFRHTTPTPDFTANLTNFYCNNNHVSSVSLMIIQGATAYIPTALQISGTGQTIKWQGGSAPTGNANKTDVFTFTITNLGASYDVIAQLVDFG